MSTPGFTAEASLQDVGPRDIAARSKADGKRVVPQFCWCDCRLVRTCINLPPLGVPKCFYREVCIPHGNCPPGYCGPH